MVDTMRGRRNDGHIPGGNHIDTVCHPATNVIFLDAAKVHESVIAHELGHAWVQYVDECEDLRTMRDASDPQRMRMVGFIQSFVLDLKVNELLRRKGFDMGPIDADRDASLWQLAQAMGRGYNPKHVREEVFMALLVADKMIEASSGQSHDLVRVYQSLNVIRHTGAPLARLAERLADSVERHGYDSHPAIVASIDECLISAFEHCGERFDLDDELIAVKPEEPTKDKFPAWLPALTPKTKTVVGKFMALNDIASDWPQRLEPSITGKARVYFRSPSGEEVKQVRLNERIGPPNRYSDLPEDIAELLALKHRNQTGSYQLHGGPPFQPSDLHRQPGISPPQAPTPGQPAALRAPELPATPWAPRPYMAGYGRFLTQAALEMQLAGEHPYAYAMNNPTTYTDPSGQSPLKGTAIVKCAQGLIGTPCDWHGATDRNGPSCVRVWTMCADQVSGGHYIETLPSHCPSHGHRGVACERSICDTVNSLRNHGQWHGISKGCKPGDLITIGIQGIGAYKSCGSHSGVISAVDRNGRPTKVIMCSEQCPNSQGQPTVCEVDLSTWLQQCKQEYGNCWLIGCGGAK
jgi:hypothetical protein